MNFEFTPEYRQYIKSPKWKLTCQRYWYIHGKQCQACGSRKDLHVHHKSYDRFGREPMSDLAGVCHSCHKQIHETHRRDRSVSLRLVTERFIAQKKKGKRNTL